jgi:nicotinate-nucleotide pyrophosphorylase (carboxylating)
MFLPPKVLEEKLLRLLAEDLGQGDITTALTVPPESTAKAEVITKEHGIAAGIEEGKILLESLGLKAETLVKDGEKIKPKQVLIRIQGNTRTILTVERTLLNLLSRMSGIATTTKEIVEKIQKSKLHTKVAATRKTTPGLLYFDKKAVQVGGGDTHRLHLEDMILIKDNHIAAVGSLEKAVKQAKQKASFSKKIEVEVTTIEDALHAATLGVDIIMLDNFSPKKIRETISQLKKTDFYGNGLIEASGGITKDNVLKFAQTGVDIVSLGEITESVRALDIHLGLRTTLK